ncbi:MAG: HAMP domain-containing protein [Chloroflexi bacterium]|nr:HAMP domain-containing protein [Chloroflexota bacterium]
MARRAPGIAARIALASLAVAAIALGVVAVGVLRVGGESFEALMMAAGESAERARAMFDESVTLVFGLALGIAALVALVLAAVFARMLARPLQRLAGAAERVAAGDLTTRVPEDGPAEVRALATAYNTMAGRLEEQEMMRREFVVNAAHEIRTPLTNLQGYLEALRDGVLPPDPATFDSLREEVDRLGRLAASLDVLAGAEGERPRPQAVDLASLVRSAAELAGPALARRSVTLAVTAEDGLWVEARPDELVQVMSNLLQNAIRYTPPGGSVRVAAARTPDGAVVWVKNSGARIPSEDLPRVWERFYRVEKSRDRARGGAGIGLAIVKRLVEDAGGRVGAASDDAWTTFWFQLPART